MKPPLLGSEIPRIHTTEARELTPRTSLGFEAIEFAEGVLKVALFPWQKWFLIHALELLPSGEYRFRVVLLLVGRQNGKSTLMQVLSLWRMYMDGPAQVVGTAQNLSLSERLWDQTVLMAEGIPELACEIEGEKDRPGYGVVRRNGARSLNLGSGSQYAVVAATRKAGRGISGHLVLLDELREHMTFDCWSAVANTTMAKSDSQIMCPSNAGSPDSLVLRHLRLNALRAASTAGVEDDELRQFGGPAPSEIPEDLESVEDDSVGIFEWSAAPKRGRADRAGWAEANPSLGYPGGVSERAMITASQAPEWEYRIENLCQWRPTAEAGPFPGSTWFNGTDMAAVHGDSRSAAVDVSWNRQMAYVAVASETSEGRFHISIEAMRAGTEWVAAFVGEKIRAKKIAHVVIQGTGAPASSLIDELREECGEEKVLTVTSTQMGAALGLMIDKVTEGSVTHREQPVLDVAAAQSRTRKVSDTALIDRSGSPVDAAPLVAAIEALWGIAHIEKSEKNPQVHSWPDELISR